MWEGKTFLFSLEDKAERLAKVILKCSHSDNVLGEKQAILGFSKPPPTPQAIAMAPREEMKCIHGF